MTDEELRQLFSGLNARFDRVDAKSETLHEDTLGRFDRLAEAVTAVDQKIERIATDLSARIEKGAVETQAMIRFSHAELDRRMHTLE